MGGYNMKSLKKVRSYSDFILEHLQELLGISNTPHTLNLLKEVIPPSDYLQTALARHQRVPN